jgi:hypothetical protein
MEAAGACAPATYGCQAGSQLHYRCNYKHAQGTECHAHAASWQAKFSMLALSSLPGMLSCLTGASVSGTGAELRNWAGIVLGT